MRKLFFAITVLGLLGTVSCNKSNTNSTPTPPANKPPQVTTPSDAQGIIGVARVLASYSTPSVPGVPAMDFDYKMGLAFAYFSDNFGSGTFYDAGNISVIDSALTKAANNTYNYTPTGTPSGNDMGLNTSYNSYLWKVSGSSNVPGFTYSASGSLPGIGKINSSKDINTSSSYTVTLASAPSNCDSIIWLMVGPSGSAQHTTGPSVSSYTFTAAEVGSLGKGDNVGLVQVAPYRINAFLTNGKKYYYVRESCATMFGNLK